MTFPEFTCLSPHRDAAPANERAGVCCHHSVLPFDATVAHLLAAESKVSYHCLIALDGTRCSLVLDEHIAWHAGASHFLGRARCNDFLLGLAFAGDTYATPLTPAQLASALDWLAPRFAFYRWPLNHITDHRQISPGRKNDLNPPEWARLHAAISTTFFPAGTQR